MSMNASIYTKSRFYGMSIGVNLIGKGNQGFKAVYNVLNLLSLFSINIICGIKHIFECTFLNTLGMTFYSIYVLDSAEASLNQITNSQMLYMKSLTVLHACRLIPLSPFVSVSLLL